MDCESVKKSARGVRVLGLALQAHKLGVLQDISTDAMLRRQMGLGLTGLASVQLFRTGEQFFTTVLPVV